MMQSQNINNNRPINQLQGRPPPNVPQGQGQQPMRPPPTARPAPVPNEQQQQNQNIQFSVNPAMMASGYSALSSFASMNGNSSLPQMPTSLSQQLPNQNYDISVNPATVANTVQAASSIANNLNSLASLGSSIPLVPKRPTNSN